MPVAAAHPCAEPRCPTLVERGTARCPAHDLKRRHYAEHPRGSSTQQGYGAAWREMRAAFLAQFPLCMKRECGELATVVDHIEPHRGDAGKFWDVSNLQALCATHHNRKTAREGRWGGR